MAKLTQVIAQVGVLLELRVVEALPAVEDARLARLGGEPAERAHDGVAHPLSNQRVSLNFAP